MKPISLFYFLISFIQSFSQSTNYVRQSSIGVHFILNDFKNKSVFGKASAADAGLSLNYLKGFGSHFDYSINLTTSFPDSISKKLSSNEKSLLLQSDFSFRARLLGRQHWINPFIQSGFGLGFYHSQPVSYFLFGSGVEFNYKDVYFTTSVQYRPSISNKLNNHYFYSIGISGLIGKKENKKKIIKTQKTQTTVFVRDSDGDGIVDSADACPTIPGLFKYHGCPLPDRDKDGIADEDDNCPDISGVLKYHGCPIPDTDGDGINDEQDSCISIVGVRENHGCPLLKKEIRDKIDLAAKNIFFKTGSYELLPKSFSSLDEVVKILRENSSLFLSVEGHTDNVGTSQSNQILSENRAKAVKQYLISKGIDNSRLSAIGYGQTKPIDTNITHEGRAKNRRVELKLN